MNTMHTPPAAIVARVARKFEKVEVGTLYETIDRMWPTLSDELGNTSRDELYAAVSVELDRAIAERKRA